MGVHRGKGDKTRQIKLPPDIQGVTSNFKNV